MKKFKSLCTAVLLVSLISSYASAVNVWIGPGGFWSNPANWSSGTVPDGNEETQIGIPVNVTLDSYEAWTSYYSNRMVVNGGATLNIVDGSSWSGSCW